MSKSVPVTAGIYVGISKRVLTDMWHPSDTRSGQMSTAHGVLNLSLHSSVYCSYTILPNLLILLVQLGTCFSALLGQC